MDDLEPIADDEEMNSDPDDCASDPSDLVVESDIDGVSMGDESLGEDKGSEVVPGSCSESEYSQESADDDGDKDDHRNEPPMAPHHEPEPEHASNPAETPNQPPPKLKAFWQKFVVPKHGGEKDPMSDNDNDGSPFHTSEPQDVKSEPSESESPEPMPSPEAGAVCESPEHQDTPDDMSWDGEGAESEVDDELHPVVSEDAFLDCLKDDAMESFAKVG